MEYKKKKKRLHGQFVQIIVDPLTLTEGNTVVECNISKIQIESYDC